MNSKTIIFELYSNKLLGNSVTHICEVLSKKYKTTKHNILKSLIQLEQKGSVVITNGIVSNKTIEQKPEQKLNNDFLENLVLGVIKTDGKGYYYFSPTATTLQDIPLVATEQVKNAVGKRCCCDIQQINGLLNANLKQVFGETDDPISENIAIAYKYGFKKHFSQEVLDEVANIPQQVSPQDLKNRKDMRNIFFMTWDPATCKDKDDAIYAEKTDLGYRVYVAIADVSHYVKKGTELDKEAFRRGTSCYLGSGVYPMLPPELSNGICSLNEKVDRLALVSVIDINNKGKIIDYKFEKAVINVKQAFSYEIAEKVFLNQDGFDKKYLQAKPYTDLLYQITDVLEKRLKNRGSLNFLNYETEFVFNPEKNIVEDVETAGKERSHKVVEMFMILANEATSKYFIDNEMVGIYRNHEGPIKNKLDMANMSLKKYGFKDGLVSDNKVYQTMLEHISNLPAKEYLNSVVMFTMSKAKYATDNMGHFGLGSKGYTHFTSPIRRYADTIAHRLISENLEFGKTTENNKHLTFITQHLNEQEAKSTKAEKDSDKMLCCLWAQNHINEVLNGFITRVDPAQIVVRHKGALIQIPTYLLKNGINSEFVLINDNQSLKNKHTGQIYNLGDYVDFKISQIDNANYTIFGTTDLELTKKNTKQPEFTL